MKVNTLNLYMGSIYNSKRVGDMTFDEVRAIAFQWIMVKKKCKRMVILKKKDGEKRLYLFSRRRTSNEPEYY